MKSAMNTLIINVLFELVFSTFWAAVRTGDGSYLTAIANGTKVGTFNVVNLANRGGRKENSSGNNIYVIVFKRSKQR